MLFVLILIENFGLVSPGESWAGSPLTFEITPKGRLGYHKMLDHIFVLGMLLYRFGVGLTCMLMNLLLLLQFSI